jgi:methylmalonyl-CoA mutase cobalamin-binding domain/chain
MSVAGQQIQLIELLADLEEEAVLELVQKRVAEGDNPLQIIQECNAGMRRVGERYEEGRYFLSGLIMAGEIFREVMELMQPVLEGQAFRQASGRILLGTVQGDIHDIGKDMVGLLLICYGFTVIDLGVDVAPAEFAEQVARHKPDVVGLSGVLTASHAVMRETVALLRTAAQQAGLQFPIIIGGGMIDDQICRYVGADYWVADAMSGVHLCQKLIAGADSGEPQLEGKTE